MSYDLYLYRVPPGADPLQAPRAAFESVDDPPAPPDAPERMAALASALREAHPALAMRSGGEGGDAFVLLQSNASGIQVWLFPTHCTVDVAYWHSGEEAVAALREAWGYAEMLEREAGSRTYDPQLDRVLDLRTDFDAALAAYGGGMRMMEELDIMPRGAEGRGSD
jgi:hypothetical protein